MTIGLTGALVGGLLTGVAVVALTAAWAVHAVRARRPAAPGDAPTSTSASAEADA